MPATQMGLAGLTRVHLLERLPELGEALTESERDEARQVLRAPAATFARGLWQPPATHTDESSVLGLLVLDGLVLRQLTLGGSTHAELLGPYDLLRPWAGSSPHASHSFEIGWRMLSETTVAVIDERFVAAASRWPPIIAALLARASARIRALDLSLAVCATIGLDQRLRLLFGHFADQWGHTVTGGVNIPLNLTHETIGELVGARRPSVSSALKQLERQGVLCPERGKGWLLRA